MSDVNSEKKNNEKSKLGKWEDLNIINLNNHTLLDPSDIIYVQMEWLSTSHIKPNVFMLTQCSKLDQNTLFNALVHPVYLNICQYDECCQHAGEIQHIY